MIVNTIKKINLYKNQITPKEEEKMYCCHTWPGYTQSARSSPDKVQKRRGGFVDDELFPTQQPLFRQKHLANSIAIFLANVLRKYIQ